MGGKKASNGTENSYHMIILFIYIYIHAHIARCKKTHSFHNFRSYQKNEKLEGAAPQYLSSELKGATGICPQNLGD